MDTLQDVFRGSSSKEIDYIQYSVYLPPKENDQATISYLQDTLDMINSYIQPLVQDHLWQKDKFHLSIVFDRDQDPSYPFLFGASRFGDCVNDEWFIVHLLKTISQKIPEAVISLVDNDGDVLLIEAALDLPSWLDPSNSQNRVHLHQGQVHIIPLPTSPADILRTPSSGHLARQQAIDHIRRSPNTTQASPAIQRAIDERLQTFPDHEIHHARCILPNAAAFVLLKEPQLITMAVEAFYLRDPISMKACASMHTFSPRQGLTDTVIAMTKTTYAQTVSQKFYAPKPFRLPSVNEKNKFRYAELGMKIACGLEMLYHSAAATDFQVDTDMEYAFDKDPKYATYLSHLTKLGYFRKERKGSKLYQLLEKQSKEQYLQHKKESAETKRYVSLDDLDVDDEETFQGNSNVLTGQGSIRQIIDSILQQYSEEVLQPLIQSRQEDSDDWMNVDPQQLEELLMKRMGTMKDTMMADLQKDFDAEQGMDLEAIMSNLENFVENSKSGVEGVEFPGETEEEDSDDDQEIEFDMEKFMRILKGTPEEQDLSQVMDEMDQEINSHDKISGSFVKMTAGDEEEEEEDEDAPVDVQLNLVKNVLESFKSQQGLPGPVGNILNQFGFVLPGDNEQEE